MGCLAGTEMRMWGIESMVCSAGTETKAGCIEMRIHSGMRVGWNELTVCLAGTELRVGWIESTVCSVESRVQLSGMGGGD